MEDKTRVIKIESIFGGQSPYTGFASEDQFRFTHSVDCESDGYLNPSFSPRFSGGTLAGVPLWIKEDPKTALVYVYDSVGSVYSINSNTLVGVGDLNDGGSGAGNGMEYYDNYLYFARASTVARYGPLNGTPVFTDAYWTSTLGKTALTDTTYPTNNDSDSFGLAMPNHVMKRHNDGNLYFADVVGNQGVLHKISTTKTTVEGDTDNGSTFNVIDFPYGYWPTAIESLGNNIVVALYSGEGSALGSGPYTQRAKLAFWDPTNPNTYIKLIDFEFPDPIIFALKNTNGILYIVSGNEGLLRVTRFIGEYSFEQITTIVNTAPPFPGGIDGAMNRLYFGVGDSGTGSVKTVGRERSGVGNEVFSVSGASSTSNSRVTSVLYTGENLISGWGDGGSVNCVEGSNSFPADNPNPNPQWISQVYRIGQPFKITAIKFSTTERLPESGQSLGVYVLFDTTSYGTSASEGTLVKSLTYSEYGANKKRFVLRPSNLTGDHSFSLAFDWVLGAGSIGVSKITLPITIEYELLND